MCKIWLYVLILSFTNINAQNLPKVINGKIERLENFNSKFVEPRNIDIWLPESYDGKKKFAVLYMHDGQMLFDSAMTWNHQAWNVDDVIASLVNEKKIEDLIVVGIWNAGAKRHANYFPQKPFDNLSSSEKDTIISQLQMAGRTKSTFQPNSDNYLKFLVKELKPFIDNKYKVYKDKKHTFIAGSSMGGLISMYAFCEYPKIFGGAACLSTHWVGTFKLENNPIPNAFIQYLKENLPKPSNGKIYFDCGDQTLDALYPEIQKKVDIVMKSKGYNDKSWQTLYFKGKDHSEKAWAERLHLPILFLAQKK